MTQTQQVPTASRLFESARLGGLELPSRLVMAPLTRHRAGADGVPGALMATYYAQRASAGLIIAEGTTPSAVGQAYPNIPGIHSAEQIAGWRRVTDAVRAGAPGPGGGAAMFLQLEHGGRIGHPDTSGHVPLAPSAVTLPEPLHTPGGLRNAATPRAMTAGDIRATVADFATAARNAVQAGFAGVEVHAANGFLPHQFLARGTNLRTDEWGGPVENRIRFTVEVVRAVAGAVGRERVGVRISPGVGVNGIEEGDTGEIYPALLAALAEIDPVYLHILYADQERSRFQEHRKAWPGTLMANQLLSREQFEADGGKAVAERLLAEGADLVSLGRGFLANPDFVERLRTGAPLNGLRPELMMHVSGPEGYTDYPVLARGAAPASAGPRGGRLPAAA
ncbi:alkene reductase [Streptomyces sp. NBC_01264]|uniref:alkene reductase n=1 Tax=Streptomyces sp. NBC_01264 TaxID=2903804 RepID=UPI00224EA8DF|nr:alkene reductase [Streptomyces sp. NBC_01264]MCX4777364.1 alkene reductase [Streptomyces sp. NBC_01264]